MVRYLKKGGKKIKLLPPAILPEEDLHCPECQVKFDRSANRRACFDLCGHLICLQCIFKMKDGCAQCSSNACAGATQESEESIRQDNPVILEEKDEKNGEPRAAPSPQPVLVLSCVLGRAVEDEGDEDAFPEIQRLSLSVLPLESISRQQPSPVPLVNTLVDDDKEEDQCKGRFNETCPADASKTNDLMNEPSQLKIKDISEDDKCLEFTPRLLRPRRKNQSFRSICTGKINISDADKCLEPTPRLLRQQRKSQRFLLTSTDKINISEDDKCLEFTPRLLRQRRRLRSEKDLEIHRLIHTNERPFQRTGGDSAFNRQFTLSKHLEKNHGISKEKQKRMLKKKKISKANGEKEEKLPVAYSRLPNGEPFRSIPMPWMFVKAVRLTEEEILKATKKSTSTPTLPTADADEDAQKENKINVAKSQGIKKAEVKGELVKRSYIRGKNQKLTLRQRRKAADEKNRQQRQFPCSHCKQTFLGKFNLARHMRQQHMNDRPFTCDLCGWCFKQKNKLELHRITHTIDRPHKCKQCDSTFNRKYSLERHVRLKHLKKPRKSEAAENRPSQKRPAKCPYCEGHFGTREIMVQHMNFRHSDMRPHICVICQYPFSKQKFLNAHMKCTHSTDRPFQCAMCESKYNKRFSLERHMENVHGVRLHPNETLQEGEEYCPDCQSVFGSEGCTKVAYAECGHVSCMDCVIRAELGCGQCTTENAPKSLSQLQNIVEY